MIERLGKYQGLAQPGFTCILWPLDNVSIRSIFSTDRRLVSFFCSFCRLTKRAPRRAAGRLKRCGMRILISLFVPGGLFVIFAECVSLAGDERAKVRDSKFIGSFRAKGLEWLERRQYTQCFHGTSANQRTRSPLPSCLTWLAHSLIRFSYHEVIVYTHLTARDARRRLQPYMLLRPWAHMSVQGVGSRVRKGLPFPDVHRPSPAILCACFSHLIVAVPKNPA